MLTSIDVNLNDKNYVDLAICTLYNLFIKHSSLYVKPTSLDSENSGIQDLEEIDVSGQLFPLHNCNNARNSSVAAKRY